MRSAKMNRFLNGNDLKSIQTTTHAHTVEMFIRTFKTTIYIGYWMLRMKIKATG